jgi:hypothetical protein
MSNRDAFAERGRSLEEDYFRKKDQELIAKLREANAAEQARKDLSGKTGISDPAVLQELQNLGFTPETIALLPLVPVVEVAWLEGGVTDEERDLLVRLARSRGIEPDSAADRMLDEWLTEQPDTSVFTRARRLVRAMIDAGSSETANADDLVAYCEQIASASGGIFGMGKISSKERALLAELADDLKKRE